MIRRVAPGAFVVVTDTLEVMGCGPGFTTREMEGSKLKAQSSRIMVIL
jgi:hypothetical protein